MDMLNPPTKVQETGNKEKIISRKKFTFVDYMLFFILAGLIVFFSLSTKVFFSNTNLINILTQVSMTGLMAIGMTYVIITGGIDLSSGSVFGLTGVICGILSRDGYGAVLPVVIALLIGGIVGFFNGILVTKAKLPPFIVTFGSMSIARGMALIVTRLSDVTGVNKDFTHFFNQKVFGFFPFAALCFIIIFLITLFIERNVPFVRYIYAVGDNEKSARLSGVPVDKVKLVVYTALGILSAFASALLVARVEAAEPNMGTGYEFTAIGAVVIGGTSLNGGRGSVLYTLIGILILGILTNGFNLIGVPAYYQQVISGAIIIVAVLLDKFRTKE